MTEIADKLATIRRHMTTSRLAAVRLRGSDWFAWATAGGSSVVLSTTEFGVAEVLVTASDAWVMTDAIEADRLQQEEVPPELPVWSHPWATPERREEFVHFCTGGGAVASDRPVAGELALPSELARARWSLGAAEIERYRALGRAAAQAMTEVMQAARPEWRERELAGAGSEALWGRGIDPALILVAGERRLPIHRHPTPQDEPLGARAMMVFCARRHGLYACFTRHVYFRTPDAEQRELALAVAAVESAALTASRPGTPLGEMYAILAAAYESVGHPRAITEHHQGGPCGYAAREAVARPGSGSALVDRGAVAWNPSLAGFKIEDTALVLGSEVEFLTVDPAWPIVQVDGRARPDLLAR